MTPQQLKQQALMVAMREAARRQAQEWDNAHLWPKDVRSAVEGASVTREGNAK